MPHTAWNGSFNRSGAWGFTVTMSLISFYFNACLLIAVIRLKDRKTSTDVLIGGLVTGILVGCTSCAPQCIFNLVFREFAFGESACFMEAFFHLWSMEIQFACVCVIAYRTYIGIVLLKPFTFAMAYKSIAIIWCVTFTGTLLLGHYSTLFMVTSGVACFYTWTSLALVAWAWPMAIIAAGLMGYWYYQTFKTVADVRKRAEVLRVDGSKRNGELMLKLSVLVVLFVFGYSGIICQSLYEMISGLHVQEWGDMTALALLLIYWVACPFAYSLCNNRLGLWSTVTSIPSDPDSEWEKENSGSSKESNQKIELTPIPITETSPPSPQSPHQRQSTNIHTLHHCTTIVLTSLRGAQRLEGSPEGSADSIGPGESCEIYCGHLLPASISPPSRTINSSFAQLQNDCSILSINGDHSPDAPNNKNDDDILARSNQRLLFSSEPLDRSGSGGEVIVEGNSDSGDGEVGGDNPSPDQMSNSHGNRHNFSSI